MHLAQSLGDGLGALDVDRGGLAFQDRVLLERMAHNLIENAVRYNIPGGWIRVATTSPGTMEVCNSGSLIEPAEVHRLFESFHRRDATRLRSSMDGVGLGLTIVEAVVSRHSGTVLAEPGPSGGLRICVSLPAKS